mgnify:CR=1 FL=1
MGNARAPRRLAADAAGIAEAVRQLKWGEIVALPTETVYGLAADAIHPGAIARIYRAKGRPPANPLIVHVSGRAMAERYAEMSPLAERLIARFWPGPLTLVLPKRADAPLTGAVTAGLSTVALRAPDHPVMQAVIEGLGRGIAAPSANVSGRLSPTDAAHVDVPGLKWLLDGGPCRVGLESSIVRPEPDRLLLLRPGVLGAQALAAAMGVPVERPGAGAAVEAPGMMWRHYAPRLPLDLDVTQAMPDRFWIGFGPVAGDLNLSPSGNLEEAAAGLFAALHQADASGAARIGVAPIPSGDAGAAIHDRLARAAAGSGVPGHQPAIDGDDGPRHI